MDIKILVFIHTGKPYLIRLKKGDHTFSSLKNSLDYEIRDYLFFPCLSLDDFLFWPLLAPMSLWIPPIRQTKSPYFFLPVLASSLCGTGCVYFTVRTGHHMWSLRVSGGVAGAKKGKPPGFMEAVTLQNLILWKPGKSMFVAKMVAQLYQQKKRNSSSRGCHFFSSSFKAKLSWKMVWRAAK